MLETVLDAISLLQDFAALTESESKSHENEVPATFWPEEVVISIKGFSVAYQLERIADFDSRILNHRADFGACQTADAAQGRGKRFLELEREQRQAVPLSDHNRHMSLVLIIAWLHKSE
jgi:hypothetical protein